MHTERMEDAMYKACIFDLDGTLADTLKSLTFSVNETMKEIGLLMITEEQCRKFVGNGAKVLIEEALRAGGDSSLHLFDRAFAAYQRIFDANCTYMVDPYPGVTEMIAWMKDQGMKLGVLSNKPDRQAVHVVKEIFGEGVFDQVRGQRDGVPRKPDPSEALSMAADFGISPDETLYVGDSEVDAATGRAAGMDTILVSWGFRSREELKAAASGADTVRVTDSADEILAMINERRNKDEHVQ